MSAIDQPQAERAPLALICGGGRFPLAVAEAAVRRGRRVILFPIRGWADPIVAARYPHQWVTFGQLGGFVRRARAERCRDIVFIGTVLRPSIRQLRFDFATLRLLPRIIRLFRGGDNHLLSGLGRIMDDLGFRLVGAHEVAPEIIIPEGTLGRHQPLPRDLGDVAFGLSLLAAMGPFDVGQAAVVANNHVLAVEATEGTDQMLMRVAAMRKEGRINLPNKVGVLVKAPKQGQDRRFDLPSIGERTVEAALAAGLTGIAVEAAGAITVDLQELIRACDDAGLFLVGVRHGASGEQL
jgi:DUF1009 family protein